MYAVLCDDGEFSDHVLSQRGNSHDEKTFFGTGKMHRYSESRVMRSAHNVHTPLIQAPAFDRDDTGRRQRTAVLHRAP
jgi:hypothetical protein